MIRQARIASELGRLHGGRTSPESCRRRTSSLPRPRSAGRSRSSPSGWNRRWWWTESWNRRRGRRPQRHRPAGRGVRSRSAACAYQTIHCRLRPQRLDFGTLHRVPPSLIFYLFLHTVLRFGDSLEPQLSSSADVTYLVSTGPLAVAPRVNPFIRFSRRPYLLATCVRTVSGFGALLAYPLTLLPLLPLAGDM